MLNLAPKCLEHPCVPEAEEGHVDPGTGYGTYSLLLNKASIGSIFVIIATFCPVAVSVPK